MIAEIGRRHVGGPNTTCTPAKTSPGTIPGLAAPRMDGFGCAARSKDPTRYLHDANWLLDKSVDGVPYVRVRRGL